MQDRLTSEVIIHLTIIVQAAHERRAHSIRKPSMFIEIDGMDTSKTWLPSPAAMPKKLDGLAQMGTHLTGLLYMYMCCRTESSLKYGIAGVLQKCAGNVTRYKAYSWYNRFRFAAHSMNDTCIRSYFFVFCFPDLAGSQLEVTWS